MIMVAYDISKGISVKFDRVANARLIIVIYVFINEERIGELNIPPPGLFPPEGPVAYRFIDDSEWEYSHDIATAINRVVGTYEKRVSRFGDLMPGDKFTLQGIKDILLKTNQVEETGPDSAPLNAVTIETGQMHWVKDEAIVKIVEPKKISSGINNEDQ